MTEAPQLVAANKVVSIHYTLTVDGKVMDSSQGDDPLEYLHGAQNIVPGLERELAGKAPGDAVSAQVSPVDGYGERSEQAVQQVPRSAFPADAQLEIGTTFQAIDEDQNPMIGTVLAAADEILTVDFNHPLAGQTLHFEVSIEGIREATAEELEHGHAHGPHGHDH